MDSTDTMPKLSGKKYANKLSAEILKKDVILIKAAVETTFGMDITCKTRKREYADARSLFVYEVYKYHPHYVQEEFMAEFLPGWNRSGVPSMLRKAKNLLETSPAYNKAHEAVIKKLEALRSCDNGDARSAYEEYAISEIGHGINDLYTSEAFDKLQALLDARRQYVKEIKIGEKLYGQSENPK